MHVKQMEESLTGRVAIEHLSENTLGSLIPGIVFAKFKRAGDIVTAAIALPLLPPFLVLVAVLIKLDSSGPVLFPAAHGISRPSVPDVQVQDHAAGVGRHLS
jgi:lipopolysaccharide/colanic/teichoic acid biosynthesis glycosyltransferase